MLFQAIGKFLQCPLRRITRQHDSKNGKQSEINLINSRFFGLLRQFRLYPIHGFAHIVEGDFRIYTWVEFKSNRCVALGRHSRHFVKSRERLKFRFERTHQQALCIRWRYTVECRSHIEYGHRHIRRGFFGNGCIGHSPQAKDEHQQQKHCSASAYSGINNCVHDVRNLLSSIGAIAPAPEAQASGLSTTWKTPLILRYKSLAAEFAVSVTRVGRTRSPAATKPWPLVIRRTRSGNPVTHTPSDSARTISTLWKRTMS